MEALTAVAVAGLTLHDMVKAVDPAAVLDGVRLISKEGGKRGHWTRDDAPGRDETTGTDEQPVEETGRSAAVVVASTGVAAGTREDRTGPLIRSWLEDKGFTVRGPLVHADADIAARSSPTRSAPALPWSSRPAEPGRRRPTRPPKRLSPCSIVNCPASRSRSGSADSRSPRTPCSRAASPVSSATRSS